MWKRVLIIVTSAFALTITGCVHTVRSMPRGVLRVTLDPHTLVKSENTALLHSQVVQYFNEQGLHQCVDLTAQPDYLLKGVVTNHDICNTAYGLTRMSHAAQINVTVDWSLFTRDGTLVWQGPVTASHTVMKPFSQSVYWYHLRNGLQVVYRKLAKILYVTICQRL